MTTIVDSSGRIKAAGDQTLVQGTYKPYNDFWGVKVYRTATMDASNGITISWQGAIWDTGGFVAAFPTTNIVIPRNGWHSVIAYVNTSVNTVHAGRLDIMVGSTVLESGRVNLNSAAGGLMNALSVSLSDYYFTRGNIITVVWDTNGITGITPSSGGENGVTCTVWRTG